MKNSRVVVEDENYGIIGEITLDKNEIDSIQAIENKIKSSDDFGLCAVNSTPLGWWGDYMSKGISECVNDEKLYPIIEKAIRLWQKALDEGYAKTDETKYKFIDLLDDNRSKISSILIVYQMNRYVTGFTICFAFER